MLAFAAEGRVGLGCRRRLHALQKTSVRRFVENLAQRCQQNPGETQHLFRAAFSQASFHTFSPAASRVITNGASHTGDALFPLRMPTHTRTDSITTRLTMTTKTVVTAASRRLLKMSRPVSLVTGPAASARACARKPMRGLRSSTLCHDAV